MQGYTAAMALTGLLVAGLEAAHRNAMRTAKDWRTRFEAAIGAHRLNAYEWDPVGGGFVVTGDTGALLGVPAESIAHTCRLDRARRPDERDAVATAFAMRAGRRVKSRRSRTE